MKINWPSVVASTLVFGASAQEGMVEDVLHSKRGLNKRFIDSEGNYNICKSYVPIGFS